MKSRSLLFACAVLGLAVLVAGACSEGTTTRAKPGKASAAARPETRSPADSAAIADQLASYPLSVCPVSGETLGAMGEPYNHVHEGRLVRFCCDGCLDEFNADPSSFLAKIDAAASEAATGG
jgi:hypothetical protein